MPSLLMASLDMLSFDMWSPFFMASLLIESLDIESLLMVSLPILSWANAAGAITRPKARTAAETPSEIRLLIAMVKNPPDRFETTDVAFSATGPGGSMLRRATNNGFVKTQAASPPAMLITTSENRSPWITM